jgi:chromosome segregation ATPase
MISLRKLSILAIIATFSFGLASCSKKDEQLATDYATKKASAQTLIDQINQSMTTMHIDHDQWMATLTTAGAKPGADTATIGLVKSDLTKHEADMAAISALIDTAKMYMNASPDQADSLKNADDKLGTASTDLTDKWKSFQDAHASLQQRIQQLAVTSAVATAVDTTMAAAKKAEPAKRAPTAIVPPAEQHHGAVRKSAQ